MSDNKISRNSSIEILRCILMIQIIFYHLLVHGTNGTFHQFFDNQPLPTTLIESFFLIFNMFPVDCFMIISGYYGLNIIKGEKINIGKVLRIYIPIFFYSVTFGTIAFIHNGLPIKEYVHNFLPIYQSNYWFITCYFILMLLSPFFNAFFEQFCRNKMFICYFITIGFINYLCSNSHFSSLLGLGYNKFFTILYCYFIGKFIKVYESKLTFSSGKSFLFFGSSFVIEYGIIYLVLKITGKNLWIQLSLNSSPFTILQAIMIFLFFKKFSFQSKFINLLGRATFAVYLIHENQYIRKPLYSIINGGGVQRYS